jgi:ATP-binding cassette subfamily G (WHITE) protein 2 (PDR)
VPASARTCNTKGSVPGQSFVDGEAFINISYAYYRSHLWRNLGILFIFMVAFIFFYLIATELVSATPSKGEVLVFRKKHLKARKRQAALAATGDEEAPPEKAIAAKRAVEKTGPGRNEKVAGIQRQTAVFHWKDVCYDIPVKGGTRRLLDHVDGWVKPGTLTALMVCFLATSFLFVCSYPSAGCLRRGQDDTT